MIRGFCPSLHEPMPSGDGLLLRVKPPGGVLRPDQAHVVADAAERFGNGIIELTMRANLQLRGFTPASAPRFAAAMVAAGLAAPDRAAERRRTVMRPPLAAPDTCALAARLETALAARRELRDLPAKFGFIVDGGEWPGLDGERADIRLRRRQDEPGWQVMRGGQTVYAPDPVAAALTLAERMGTHRAAAALAPDRPAIIGPHPGFTGIGLPFGALNATLLRDLGRMDLHLTPWRAFVVTDPFTPLPGVILDPADPLLRITACVGEPGCLSGSTDTRADAVRLARLNLPGMLHVAGCAKGCAHRAAADRTLVAESGRYGLVRQGTAGDPPAHRGLDLHAAMALLRADCDNAA